MLTCKSLLGYNVTLVDIPKPEPKRTGKASKRLHSSYDQILKLAISNFGKALRFSFADHGTARFFQSSVLMRIHNLGLKGSFKVQLRNNVVHVWECTKE